MNNSEKWYVVPDPPEPDWLQRQLAPDANILALSVRALARLSRQFGSVSSIEDFVPYREIRELADRAETLTNEFARIACGGETVGGYDIPGIAWQAQEHFFRDALLAARLGEVWKAQGISQVLWVGSRDRKPAFYLPTFDTSLVFLEEALGKRAKTLHPPTRGSGGENFWMDRFRSVPGVLEREYNDRFRQPRSAQVVVAFTEREWLRHSVPLEHLAGTYQDQFQFWSLGHPSVTLKDWALTHGITLKWVSYGGRIDADIRTFFDRQWHLWQTKRRDEFARVSGLSPGTLTRLDFHFRFFFTNLWLRLAQWARKLERWLDTARPEWVIASNDYVAAYALPHHAAAHLGIPSVALPHTFVPQGNHPITASFLACRNLYERMNYAESFPDDKRVWLCRDATNELSYAPNKTANGLLDHEKIVAILTVGEDTEGAVMAKMNRAAFLETLAALVCPPPELNDLHFVIKAHPRFDVVPLLKDMQLSPAPNVTLLDAAFPVNEVIERAWIVVQCNYFGSSVVPVIHSGKPVLFLDTAGHYWTGESRFVFRAGKTVESVGEFWDYMRLLCSEPTTYQAEEARAHDFDNEYLVPPTRVLIQWLQHDQ